MAGVIVLTGRAKDTIVLSSGENIEPSSIEDAVVCSPLIKFCVLLGQDRRSLGALIVLDPEALEDLEKEKGMWLAMLQFLHGHIVAYYINNLLDAFDHGNVDMVVLSHLRVHQTAGVHCSTV